MDIGLLALLLHCMHTTFKCHNCNFYLNRDMLGLRIMILYIKILIITQA